MDDDLSDDRLGPRGLVTTPDLACIVHALWPERIADSRALAQLTRGRRRRRSRLAVPAWPRAALRALRLGMGTNTVEGAELLGPTGFIGAFAFDAPNSDAVLAGTHNDSQVDRWRIVAAPCRELRQAA